MKGNEPSLTTIFYGLGIVFVIIFVLAFLIIKFGM